MNTLLISSNNSDSTINVLLNLLASFMLILLCVPTGFKLVQVVTTRGAIENNHTSHSQTLELGASTNPPNPH
eukprot:1141006-Pelagomonas_calceolata.AAC.2